MRRIFLCIVLVFLYMGATAERVIELKQWGIVPNTGEDISKRLNTVLEAIKSETKSEKDCIILKFERGRYDFHEQNAAKREYYISNHDQNNPKRVGICLEGWKNLSIEGGGAEFVFHGRMLPLALVESEDCELKNFSIDFAIPHITQVKILSNDGNGITFKAAQWTNTRIGKSGLLESCGETWSNTPQTGIAFDQTSRHIVYRTSDLCCPTDGVRQIAERTYHAPNWRDERLKRGTIVAMRTYERPAPAIFLAENKDTYLENVKVHYAEGMGLLAQRCENVRLEGFCVCLKGADDPRYFTTQADATHFSSCKGSIVSSNGIYEAMMDDAINVHGTYLKICKIIDRYTVVANYSHPQTYGFAWADKGDKVQFVRSKTMETVGKENRIEEITPQDKPSVHGAKEFLIRFAKPLDEKLTENEAFGAENLSWCPKVCFKGNIVRNNRARGALFSTPEKVVVEDNLFDHTSGTAILLCGDCNGWYETGACKNVRIKNNRFINSLTNMFQFTEAIISICPEIPEIEKQIEYFHSGIRIEENLFETFDTPILYAKSVCGLVFRNNTIVKNKDYPAFHKNQIRFPLIRTKKVRIENNRFLNKDTKTAKE